MVTVLFGQLIEVLYCRILFLRLNVWLLWKAEIRRTALSADVGIPSKLEAIKEEDLQFLAESAAADACAPGNPKDASVEDFKELFRKIM